MTILRDDANLAEAALACAGGAAGAVVGLGRWGNEVFSAT
jgi:hypothetical protein